MNLPPSITLLTLILLLLINLLLGPLNNYPEMRVAVKNPNGTERILGVDVPSVQHLCQKGLSDKLQHCERRNQQGTFPLLPLTSY